MVRPRDEKVILRPASTLEGQVFEYAQRAADSLMRPLEELLDEHELSPTQYNVLRILRRNGKGLACHEIGEHMITRDPDLTRLLDRLEERHLVSRSREKDDRRVIRAKITTSGQKVLKDLDEPVRTLQRRQLGHLSDRKLKLLASLLEAARST
jgi:DNA-binding MarR family transcriptional regulator